MNNNSLLYYTLIFSLLFKVSNAQNNRFVFQDGQNSSTKPCIILNLDSIPILHIKSLLGNKRTLAVSFSSIQEVNSSFLELYKKYNDSLVIISEDEINNSLLNGLHLIYRKPSDLEIISLTKAKSLDSLPFRFYDVDKLNSIKIESGAKLSDSLFWKIWKQSGRLPDFIQPHRYSFLKVDSIIDKLSDLRKVYGVVETEEGELINGVRFKAYPNSIVNGYFSFPILKGEGLPVLIPYKAGYHFSPDIIYTTPENIRNSKKFSAFQLDIDYELSDHFVFNPKFKNKIKENDKELLINDVEIKLDEAHGKVGYFNNRSYIDTGIESKNSLQESFTISAWVKPTSLGLNNSILGKGDNFVVKLRNGFLTFTMAGIKDYISQVSVIPLNKWTHIALTHSKIDNKLFFYVNGKLTEEVNLVSEYVTSDYNILIGSNLWEEFFDGYLAEIKIWERELNGSEIAILFEKREAHTSNWVLKISIIVLLITVFFLLRNYKSKKRQVLPSVKKERFKKNPVFAQNNTKSDSLESVLCFGKLRIINTKGVDLAEKLSPLLKKIFVIVFLYSHQGAKKGISTKQLTEFLWPGMSSQKAKNTRGTNINNLRSILNSCAGINLIFEDKYWLIELTGDSFCDYQVIQQYLSIFSNGDYSIKELEVELPKCLQILKEGRLFSSSSEPWLDPFIEKFSNQIIEQCLEFTEVLEIDKHSDLLLLLTDVICLYDDLNEKAHQLKLKTLIKQGKLSLAYKSHDNFEKLYHKIYKEDYAISFEEITST